MKKEFILKSEWFKILIVLVAVLILIGLYRNGYAFGQWLYQQLN